MDLPHKKTFLISPSGSDFGTFITCNGGAYMLVVSALLDYVHQCCFHHVILEKYTIVYGFCGFCTRMCKDANM